MRTKIKARQMDIPFEEWASDARTLLTRYASMNNAVDFDYNANNGLEELIVILRGYMKDRDVNGAYALDNMVANINSAISLGVSGNWYEYASILRGLADELASIYSKYMVAKAIALPYHTAKSIIANPHIKSELLSNLIASVPILRGWFSGKKDKEIEKIIDEELGNLFTAFEDFAYLLAGQGIYAKERGAFLGYLSKLKKEGLQKLYESLDAAAPNLMQLPNVRDILWPFVRDIEVNLARIFPHDKDVMIQKLDESVAYVSDILEEILAVEKENVVGSSKPDTLPEMPSGRSISFLKAIALIDMAEKGILK